jgi:hypothetical protein
MNIIQMQDKLKDLSNKQLMYYIENPQISSGAMTGSSLGQGGANTLPGAMLAGHVPAYLVIGELGRREEMRAKFSQAAPTETVSEQIIQEAVPQGIGALMPTNMPTNVPPPMAPSPESVTETGIANLPAPNVGQNYEAGGIVGYAGGGGLVIDDTMETETFYNPLTGVDTSLEDDTETVSEEPEQPYNAAFTPEYGSAAVRGPLTMPAQLTQEQAIADMRKSEKEFGIDNSLESTYRSQKELDLAAMNEKKRTNFNMSLIAAGAAGLKSGSQFALSAMGSAIEGGLTNYIKTDKDLDAEEKAIKEGIFASKRLEQAEKKGDLKAVKAAVAARNDRILEVAKINMTYDAEIQKMLATAGSKKSEIFKDAAAQALARFKSTFATDDIYNTAFQRNPKKMQETYNKFLKEEVAFLTHGTLPVANNEPLDTFATSTNTGTPAPEKPNFWED